MQDGVLADLDERLELLVHPRIHAGIGVVLEELLPFLVRHPVGRPRAVPLPAVEVLGGGNPRPVEACPVVPHGVLGAEMMPTRSDLADAVHGEPLVVEGNAPTQNPLEHPQRLDVDDEFFVRRQQCGLQPAGCVQDEVNPTEHSRPHAHQRFVGGLGAPAIRNGVAITGWLAAAYSSSAPSIRSSYRNGLLTLTSASRAGVFSMFSRPPKRIDDISMESRAPSSEMTLPM